VSAIWQEIYIKKPKTIHEACSIGVDTTMLLSAQHKTLDNITVVMIALPNLEKFI
jgi:hypothetical protein